jgi:hypothetical protein
MWLLKNAVRLCDQLQRSSAVACRSVAINVAFALLDAPFVEVSVPAGLSLEAAKELLTSHVGFGDVIDCVVVDMHRHGDYCVMKLHRPDADTAMGLAACQCWSQCVAALLALDVVVERVSVQGWLPRQLLNVGASNADTIRVVVSCLRENRATADECVASVRKLLSASASELLRVDPAVWARVAPGSLRTTHGVEVEFNADRSVVQVSGHAPDVRRAVLAIQVDTMALRSRIAMCRCFSLLPG